MHNQIGIDLPAPPVPATYSPRRRRLANGITIISLEDVSSANVAVQVWYNVGGKDDPPGRAGFAHLFEHLLFKKTQNLPNEAMDRFTEDVGGENNAYTTSDRTVYHEIVPSNHLERILWAEAERMMHLDVDYPNFRSERDVVKEEYRQSVLAQPYGRFDDEVDRLLWTVHPYRRSVIGNIGDLNTASLEDVIRFHKTFYRPDNATVIIVGDFKYAKLDALTDRIFGTLRAPKTKIPRVTIKEPERRSAQTVERYYKNLPLPIVSIVIRLPRVQELAHVEARLMDIILSGGESSRMYQELVYTSAVASDVSTLLDPRSDGSVFTLRAIAADGVGSDKLTAALRACIDAIKQNGITPAELRKAKDTLLTETLLQQETMEGKAALLGHAEVVLGDITQVNTENARIEDITLESLNAFIRSTLITDVALTATGLPGNEKKMSPVPEPIADRGSKTKRSTGTPVLPPQPGTPRPILIPSGSETKLDNGVSVVIGRQGNSGLTTLNVVIRTGSLSDKRSLEGTAFLVSELLVRGTEKLSATQIAEMAAALGGNIDVSATHEHIRIELTLPRTRCVQGLTLLNALVLRSVFSDRELELKKTEVIDNLRVRLERPSVIGQITVARILYGKTGYGRPSTGTPSSIKRLSTRDIKQFHALHFVGPNVSVVVTGDVPSDIMGIIGDTGWGSLSGVPTPGSPKPGKASGHGVILVDKRDAGQAAVFVACGTVSRASLEWPTMSLANSVLGGGYSARLNKEVRIRRGLAYGAFSTLTERSGQGAIILSAQTRLDTAGTVAEILVAEQRRMATMLVNKGELATRQSALLGPLSRSLATSSGYGDALVDQVTFNLPVNGNGIARMVRRVQQTTQTDLQNTFRASVGNVSPVVVVVGDSRLCVAQLRNQFGTVTIIPEDKWAEVYNA